MSPFDHIAATLGWRPRWSFSIEAQPAEPAISKTERMREYLRQHGPTTAMDLAMEADVPSSALVGALLKGDLARGSVYKVGNRYHWCHQFDLELHKRLKDAAALLRAHGYMVKNGASQ
jgi:hypothetical protein